MNKDVMIQETEMKQRLARMADPLKSFQTISLTLEQDVRVLIPNLHKRPGGSSL
jgi:hypothetical protein